MQTHSKETSFFIIGALPESLTNFRGQLIKDLVSEGLKVTSMSAPASSSQLQKIESYGANHISFPVQRNGLNPLSDFKTWKSLRRTLRENKPSIVLAYTIKPVIWGGLALIGLRNTAFYALITGLGFAFQGQGIIRKTLTFIVSLLYKMALSRAKAVIFQNNDDLRTFTSLGIVPIEKCHVVGGSGVDTSFFNPAPPPKKPITFLTIARLLEEKGLRFFYQAASIVKAKYPLTIFQILGSPDPSPDAISLEEIENWDKSDVIKYLGETNDVRPYLASSHIFVLASYYGEGLPRTIIEAMAMSKPILTTDNVGCRETVISGENGFLVPVKDANTLAERMIWFIEHEQDWLPMGNASRKLALERFDVKTVNAKMLQIMGLKS